MPRISNWQIGFAFQFYPQLLTKPDVLELDDDPARWFWEIWLDWYAPEFTLRNLYHETVVKGLSRNERGF